jgi:hypothetical protein
MERGEANNIDPLIAQRLEGPHNRSSWPEWINSAFLKDIETVYAAIAHGPKVGGDEINAELGRWVNIISYVLDNSLDGTLNEIQARELIARTKTVVSFLLKEPTAGGLVFAREVRHEILMDIYRAEPISRHIIKITNGSPSFAVVLGVAASAILLLILAMILPPILNLLGVHPLLYIDRSFSAQTPPALGAAALAAFLGAIASILIRLERFEARRAIDPKLLFLNAFFRPFVGMLLGLFVIGVQGIGLFSIGTGNSDPGQSKFSLFLMVVGFLAGFSERLAGDIVGTVEGSLLSDKAKGGSGPVT